MSVKGRRAAPIDPNTVATPSNAITLARICLVPVFVAVLLGPWPEWMGLPGDMEGVKRILAAVVFIVISATDWLDGYLARSRNEVTNFGMFMDPLADKILVAAALIALVELGSLPSWVVIVILSREFIVSGVRMTAAGKGVVIPASWWGKFKTAAQMIAIVLFCVKDSHMAGSISAALQDGLWVASWAVMIVALVLTVVSMLDYIAKSRDLIGLGGRRGADARPCVDCGAANSVSPGAEAHAAVSNAEGTPFKAMLRPQANYSTCSVSGLEDAESSADPANLAASVIERARRRQATLGTAESLTGGLISATLTAVPGASDVVRGSVVSYASGVKASALGVDGSVLASQGAVCEDVAVQMAKGARRVLDVDVAVAVTGIAGPGGAEPGKPVGTVWMGVSTSTGTRAHLFHFKGNRAQVRAATVNAALKVFLREL